MLTISYNNAASNEVNAASIVENPQQKPLTVTADTDANNGSDGQETEALDINNDEIGGVRTIHRLMILERIRPATRQIECFYLIAFASDELAQAWAKRVRRGCDQVLNMGEQCKSLIVVSPLVGQGGNEVIYIGKKPKWNDLFLHGLPIQTMEQAFDKLKFCYGLFWN
jgi:hypothetical protein